MPAASLERRMVNTVALALILVSLCSAYKLSKYDPLVKTKSGWIRGFRQEVFSRNVDTFLGIPFAEPPIGKLRFMPPVPMKPWAREYRAVFPPPSCIQPSVYLNRFVNITAEERSEDCLYLNLWAPSQDSYSPPEPKAVMIFFHGGAFFFGSSTWQFYDGSVLAALGDVILVTVNYRLGPLGFMNTKIPASPGNQGLYDQHVAMRWVKDNVGYFGGDPESITLFGHSAGSISIGYHIVSPMSKGLFKRAIMQSGSPYWTIADNAYDEPDRFTKAAVKMNCSEHHRDVTAENFDKVFDCLQRKNATELLEALESRGGRIRITYHPSHGDKLVPQDVQSALNGSIVNDVDLLIGAVQDEGSVFVEYYLSAVLDFKNPSAISKDSLEVYLMILFRVLKQRYPHAIRDFYLSDARDDHTTFLRLASEAMGDFAFVCPMLYFAEDYSRRNNSVYMYSFAHRPSYSWYSKWAGVAHFDEVPFVFGVTLNNSRFEVTQQEKAFTLFIMYAWTHFAKTGEMPPIGNRPWPKFTPTDQSYVQLKLPEPQAKQQLAKDRCDFWRPRILSERGKA